MTILSWIEDYGEEMYMNFNMSKLKRDEAYLDITTSTTAYLYSVYKECLGCPFLKDQAVHNETTLRINTIYPRLYRIAKEDVSQLFRDYNGSVICNLEPNFQEFGVYNLEITDSNCYLKTLKEPVNIYFPMLTVFLIYAAIFLVSWTCLYVWRVYTRKAETFNSDDGTTKGKNRVVSLDTFRGISIVFMIFVNYGCGGYEVLNHAVWNGLQPADLVFPWFLWIMGVCIPISTWSAKKRGVSIKSGLKQILRRACILFALGLFLNAGTSLDKLRVFAVLQRFSICYLAVASAFILFTDAPKQIDEKTTKLSNMFKDVIVLKHQWMLAVIIIVVHSFITFMLPIPNCPLGYLGPGGYHEDGKYFNCTGGAAGYIDKLILGNHRYQYPTVGVIYQTDFFDPEGILGFLTSIVQVIIGTQAGAIILFHQQHYSRIIRWAMWGVALALIGGVLCGFSQDDGLIPINKSLWSMSFVLVTSSLAFILLSICYCLIDMKRFWTGKPFVFAGMNSIFLYVGHSLIYDSFPIHWVLSASLGFNTHFIMLLENVWGTIMWVIISYYLYSIKFFLSV